MKIGVLDMDMPEEDQRQLGTATVALSSNVFATLKRMSRMKLRGHDVDHAKVSREIADAMQTALFNAYCLGAVRAHVGSKSATQE